MLEVTINKVESHLYGEETLNK